MKTEGTFVGWDFTNVWGIVPALNDGYPYLKFGEKAEMNIEGNGTVQIPYLIKTENDILAITEGKIGNSNSYYTLNNDISLTAVYWTPIGSSLSGRTFDGIFDGKGHKITGVNITQNNFDYSGLFGEISNSGVVKNLGVSANISVSTDYAGALAGRSSGKIESCYSTGAISGKLSIGGLVGGLYAASGSNAARIENSYSRADVTGLTAGTSNYMGGLVGRVEYYSPSYPREIIRCYATGYVRPRNDSADNVGGIAGYNNGAVSLFNYYDKSTTRQGDTLKGFSATTAQMKTEGSFVGWDFTNIWGVNSSTNDGYPYLKFGEKADIDIEGNGTKYDPYIIRNEKDILLITEGRIGKTGSLYELNNDIALTSEYWTPIGGNLSGRTFDGIFDGRGHKITGVNITQNNFDYSGLFGEISNSGVVKNLGVSANISISTDYAGALAGRSSGKIESCYSTGAISGKLSIGGLVGGLYAASGSNAARIENSYSRADVTGLTAGTSNYMGGLVGRVEYYSSSYPREIIRCYATGYVRPRNDSANNVGGIAGNHSGTFLFSYYDRITTEQSDTIKGFSATTAQMKTADTFTGWDFNNIWGISQISNDGYPYLKFQEKDEVDIDGNGSLSDPYVIKTENDLLAITEGIIGKSGSNYELYNDIALTAEYWTPIGGNLSGRTFDGIFDGKGHKITGVNITQDNFAYSGLFGEISSSGVVKNLGVSANISVSTDYAGALAGRSSGKIESCYSTGAVSGKLSIGGLVGGLYAASGSNAARIENSYSRADVTGLTAGTSNYMGGLVGRVEYYSSSYPREIIRCYATGYVRPRNDSADNVGGIAGNTSATISSCFYDKNTTGRSDSGKGVGLATSEMKLAASYPDWDFASIWNINGSNNNGYPYLRGLDPVISVMGITLNPTSMSVQLNSSDKIIANVAPVSATSKVVLWQTSNDLVVTVDANGWITGVSLGTATVTATTVDGGYSAICNITVTDAPVAPTVDTPVATPASGAVTSGTAVTLSTATGGASIRYTTNGSEPTSSSAAYTSPIPITAATTIKAKAFKPGMPDSATATFNYTVAAQPDMEVVVTGIQYKVTNNGGAQNGEVIMAIYDTSGKLVHTQYGGNATINSGDNTGSFAGINIPAEVTNKYTVKLFLWTSTGVMIPLAEIPAELYF